MSFLIGEIPFILKTSFPEMCLFYKKSPFLRHPCLTMKTKTQLLTLATLLLSSFAGVSAAAGPGGFLNVSSSVVRCDTHVSLDWSVEFPALSIEQVVNVNQETKTVQANADVRMTARILGSEYSAGWDYGYVEGFYKLPSSSGYQPIMEGWGDDVDPGVIVATDDVSAGEEVQMKFRGTLNGMKWVPSFAWMFHDWRQTGNGDEGVLILKDGDYVPNYAPAYHQESAASFLAPYLSADGTTIEIGPRDLIVLVDVDSRLGDERVDFQDFVILLTFDEV